MQIGNSNDSCETGIPLMRHLFLYDHNDIRVLDIEDEYMLGESLLVAPVLNNSNSRAIYLPKGKWKNIYDGKIYEGYQVLNDLPASLGYIPVFLKLGHHSSTIEDVLCNIRKQISVLQEIYPRS